MALPGHRAVLAKLERYEGLKQSELADLMEMQPITLTRLIDRLCEHGLIERRADANDRRVNRLYLLAEARPLLNRLAELRAEITATALAHMDKHRAEGLVAELTTIKDNARRTPRRRGGSGCATAGASCCSWCCRLSPRSAASASISRAAAMRPPTTPMSAPRRC